MFSLTISAKVPEEMTQRIQATGYTVSDLIQVSINMFMAMSKEDQNDYMLKHIRKKKTTRVVSRYLSTRQPVDLTGDFRALAHN